MVYLQPKSQWSLWNSTSSFWQCLCLTMPLANGPKNVFDVSPCSPHPKVLGFILWLVGTFSMVLWPNWSAAYTTGTLFWSVTPATDGFYWLTITIPMRMMSFVTHHIFTTLLISLTKLVLLYALYTVTRLKAKSYHQNVAGLADKSGLFFMHWHNWHNDWHKN